MLYLHGIWTRCSQMILSKARLKERKISANLIILTTQSTWPRKLPGLLDASFNVWWICQILTFWLLDLTINSSDCGTCEVLQIKVVQ